MKLKELAERAVKASDTIAAARLAREMARRGFTAQCTYEFARDCSRPDLTFAEWDELVREGEVQ